MNIETGMNQCGGTYFEEYDSACFQNCIRQILEFYGLKNPESYINMTLSRIIKLDINNGIDNYFDSGARSLIESNKNAINRRYYEELFEPEEIWKENIEYLKEGYPLIIGADSYELSYLPYYQKSHGRHTLVLTGVDMENNTAFVLDHFSNWSFRGGVSIEELDKARNSQNTYDGGIFSGKPIRYNWAYIHKDRFKGDKEQLLYEQLNLSYSQFFKRNNKLTENEYNGIFFTERLGKLLEQWRDYDEDQLSRIFEEIQKSLYKANRRLNFFSRMLRINRDILDTRLLEESIKNIYENWDHMTYQLLKCSRRANDKNMDRALETQKLIYENESLLGKLLEKTLM